MREVLVKQHTKQKFSFLFLYSQEQMPLTEFLRLKKKQWFLLHGFVKGCV